MIVHFITRFSILDPDFRGFRLSSDYDARRYGQLLFDRRRLDHKFDTFKQITLPSVTAQSHTNWKWIIYTSDLLPPEYAAKLNECVAPYPGIGVRAVRSFAEFFKRSQSYDYGDSFATVRLDDDDGVGPVFVERLQRYAGSPGTVVCFTEGRLVKLTRGRVLVGEAFSEKNSALGLSGIGLNIYNCGRHTDIDSRFPVIYDSTPEMLLLCCSPFTDTRRGFTPIDRAAARLSRLGFLIRHRPSEAREEVKNFFTRRLERLRNRL